MRKLILLSFIFFCATTQATTAPTPVPKPSAKPVVKVTPTPKPKSTTTPPPAKGATVRQTPKQILHNFCTQQNTKRAAKKQPLLRCP